MNEDVSETKAKATVGGRGRRKERREHKKKARETGARGGLVRWGVVGGVSRVCV